MTLDEDVATISESPTTPAVAPSMQAVLLAAAGLLLLQVAWMISLPAFGGIDEFDHAYRASAVAHGQWVAPAAAATRGTGAFVDVAPSLPRAARAECELLRYTGAADCIGTPHGRLTRVASGAGRYNPAFYMAIGYPTLPFQGTSALFAMRAFTALYSTALVVLALIAMRRWARSTWPFAGLLLAATPMLVYSTAIASPNGVEMAAALAFWSAAFGLLRSESAAPDRLLLIAATIAGTVLVTVRSLGPLWCLLAIAVVILSTPDGLGRLLRLLRHRGARTVAVLLGLATAASIAWTETMGSLVIGKEPHSFTTAQKLSEVRGQIPLWLFQSIAAFPYRTQAAPILVYACILTIGIGLLVVGWRGADRRLRAAMLVVVLLSTAVPALIEYQTINSYYAAWQGRYTLPFSLGLMLLAGIGAERLGGNRPNRGPRTSVVVCGALVYALGTAAGVLHVLHLEHQISPSVGNGSWTVPSDGLVIALVVAGTGLLWQLIRIPRRVQA